MSIVHYATKKFIAANVLKIAISQKEQSMKVICQKSIRKKQIGETSARIANGIIIKHQLQPVLFRGDNIKYRKKPIIVEAYRTDSPIDIETLEGTMHASPGDYIITGVNGEQYPCKPDNFEKTYEPIR